MQSRRNASDPGGAPIVVVSGLPRSGTSLLMSMLGAGGLPLLVDDHRRPDESNPRGYFELEAVRATARDARWVEAAPGHAVKVIHALLPHLPAGPRYEVLWLERDLGEVAASQRAMLGRATGARGEDGDDAAWVARFAREVARSREWLDATPGVRWMSIAHRRLIRDAALAVAEMERFLARPLDRAAMQACVDPALYRARAATPTGR